LIDLALLPLGLFIALTNDLIYPFDLAFYRRIKIIFYIVFTSPFKTLSLKLSSQFTPLMRILFKQFEQSSVLIF